MWIKKILVNLHSLSVCLFCNRSVCVSLSFLCLWCIPCGRVKSNCYLSKWLGRKWSMKGKTAVPDYRVLFLFVCFYYYYFLSHFYYFFFSLSFFLSFSLSLSLFLSLSYHSFFLSFSIFNGLRFSFLPLYLSLSVQEFYVL